jgi:aspartate/methionine/tyrosine aminotransferase
MTKAPVAGSNLGNSTISASLGPSSRSAVEPFLAMDVMSSAARLEAEGRTIVHMEVGQPGNPAPEPVLRLAREVLQDGRLGYTEAIGIRPLRERIAQHYRDSYSIEVPVERIMITTGSSGGFSLTFIGAFDPGARIALASPGYPAYRNILAALGLQAVDIPIGPNSDWVLTAELIAAEHAREKLDGVLIASPANPTGTMASADQLRDICEFCGRSGIRLISDEIYHGLTYVEPAETALRFHDEAIVINSFSKYYCMTGWRVGWMVLPENMVRPLERLAQSLFISVPELSQRAAVGAFDATDELEAVKAGYALNRDFLLQHMPRLGFDEILPVDGAFYIYASVAPFTNDSMDFARRMLEEAGVAATPGLDFDRERGNRYMRFSFAGTHEAMRQGIERLEGWLP